METKYYDVPESIFSSWIRSKGAQPAGSNAAGHRIYRSESATYVVVGRVAKGHFRVKAIGACAC